MGMDLNFVAISKDKSQLQKLEDYICALYNREGISEHRMLGYDMSIIPVSDYFALCGCHRKCYGYDLGFWCKKENKNHLLENVFYFEERQDEEEIMQYFPRDDECGMLGCVEPFYNPYSNELLNENSGIPEELHQYIVHYIQYGSFS